MHHPITVLFDVNEGARILLVIFCKRGRTVLTGTLVNPRPMPWYKAWREMLQSVRLEMSLVERRGGENGLVVGISSRSSSGSTTGIEYFGVFVQAGGLLGFSVGLGGRLCMGTCGAVGAVASIVAGLVNTLVGG